MYEIIRSVNPTKFDNIWEQNIKNDNIDICSDNIGNITLKIDTIHKKLQELYLSEINTSKDQLEGRIQKLNELFLWGINKCKNVLTDLCSNDVHSGNIFQEVTQTVDEIMFRMKTISISIISNNDISIRNGEFYSAGKDTVYNISFMQQENKSLQISMMNVTFEGIYLLVQSSYRSVLAKNNLFIRSGMHTI